MANYLPVLLVSVTAGMPDDAALLPLPRGQVDYLSHDWAEEDVWRSWRNMTKQKNEIANGVRLENASWRTWMKQRNKLKTISPETLNWLKDSDVTWLYGPLHTAVDWSPTPKPAISPPATQKAKDDVSALPAKSVGTNSLSSPSSSVALDHLNQSSGRYSIPSHEGGVKKPILKHRSIAEMLTSALPPAPSWADEVSEYRDDYVERDHEWKEGGESRSHQERREISSSGRGARPPLLHTKSDTNILPRFGRGSAPKKARISPPRVADGSADREPETTSRTYSGSLSSNQRTGASNNLAEMMSDTRNTIDAPSLANSLQTSVSPYSNTAPLDGAESSGASTNDVYGSGRADSDVSAVSPAPSLAPQKKHISFNAIVEQCIAIDGGLTPVSASTRGQSYDDDGYTEDSEDGLYEDVSMGMKRDSDSEDDLQAEDEDEDEVIEIKPPSRRSSTASLQDYRTALETLHSQNVPPSVHSERPRFRRSSTGSSKMSRSRNNNSAGSGSGSGSNSGRSSEMGMSRSSAASDREHVSIAPIAPTILKTGGAEDNEDGILYMGGAPYPNYGDSHGIVYSDNSHYGAGGGMHAGPSVYGYGYGGYGYGECVSAGRDDAFEHFERGTEAGELVYQSANGNVYPWGEGDAVRFRMQTEGPPSLEYGLGLRQRSPARRNSNTDHPRSSSESGLAQFVPGPLVSEPRSDLLVDEAEFEYFGTAEGAQRDVGTDNEHVHTTDGQQFVSHLASQRSELHPERRDKEEDTVRIVVPYSNGGTDGSDQRGPHSPGSDLHRERTPSPDFSHKVNPRIASLKYESGCRSPSPSSPSSSASDIAATLVPSSPTQAIPTPGISPVHEEDYARMRSPPDSPVIHAGLLSPPDMSPRGRSVCAPSVSSSAPSSSSVVRSSSRSISDSRSDSRGRSRTRNSSLASSPDQGEPERGRSRSRSTASGANSPLGDSCSPQSRYPLAIGGMGLGIGSGFGASHSGREIRDGHGAKLYRKTSEDFIGRHAQPESNGSRGRNREGKRVSESLSPPVVGSAVADRRSAVSPPSGSYRPIPASGQKPYSANTLGGVSSRDVHYHDPLDKNILPSSAPIVNSSEAPALGSLLPDSSRSADQVHRHSNFMTMNNSSPNPGLGTTVARTNSRTLPSCIPEEDEQHPRRPKVHDRPRSVRSTAIIIPSPGPSGNTATSVGNAETPAHASSPDTSAQSPGGHIKANGASHNADDGTVKTLADRSAELMSSARTLLGSIWNGS